jgi:aminoacrylate hydrolase
MSAAFRSFSATAFEWIAGAITTDLDYSDVLKNITTPTFVVASREDPGIPRAASELMRDEISNAELTWLSPTHHLATLENPDRFNEIVLDFLSRHAGGNTGHRLDPSSS